MIASRQAGSSAPPRAFSPDPMIAPSARWDSTDERERAHRTEPKEPADPTEKADAKEPVDPIESAEPTEPIDRNEPLEPMQRKELSDHSDSAGTSSS